MADLKPVTEELLRYVIGDQEAFYECNTLADGTWPNAEDKAEYDRVEAMIARAQKALQECEE